jgi:hypothetical protein
MSSVSFTLSILFVPSCLFLALTILVEGKSRAYHVSSSSSCLTPWEGNKLDTFSQVHHPDATHLLQLEHTNRCVHSQDNQSIPRTMVVVYAHWDDSNLTSCGTCVVA